MARRAAPPKRPAPKSAPKPYNALKSVKTKGGKKIGRMYDGSGNGGV
jgi:hypothetical protein